MKNQDSEKIKEEFLKNGDKSFSENELINQPTQPDPPRLSVGEEFVKWAEMYWRLESKYTETSTQGECAIYEHTREIFVKKINSLLEERLM